jgi:hypothetical protein
MWEISPRINSPKNDDSSLWEPLHAQTQTTTPCYSQADSSTLPKVTSNQTVHEKQHFSICGKQRGQNQTKAEAFNLLESASQRFQTISEELR